VEAEPSSVHPRTQIVVPTVACVTSGFSAPGVPAGVRQRALCQRSPSPREPQRQRRPASASVRPSHTVASFAICCTTVVPTFSLRSIFSIPTPWASWSRMACSVTAAVRGRAKRHRLFSRHAASARVGGERASPFARSSGYFADPARGLHRHGPWICGHRKRGTTDVVNHKTTFVIAPRIIILAERQVALGMVRPAGFKPTAYRFETVALSIELRARWGEGRTGEPRLRCTKPALLPM
jgi:hypothetical protein